MQRNQQAKDAAWLAMLSGDQSVERFGGAVLSNAQHSDQLQQRKAEADKGQGIVALGDGFLYDPNTGETFRDDKIAEHEATQHSRRMEQIQAQMARLPAGQRTKLAEFDSKIQAGEELIGALQASPGAVSPVEDLVGSGVKKLSTGMGQVYENWMKSDDEQDVRNKIARYEAAIRKDELGSALTGYELEKAAEWSPSAPGITIDEAVRRLRNLHADYARQYQAYLGGSTPAAAPAPQPPAPAALEQVWELDEDGNPVRVQ